MKYVYSFAEGNKNMKELLGGKGANLSEMINIGLSVPSGFIVTTEACNFYYDNNEKIDDEVLNQIYKKLSELEEQTNKKFGSIDNPLLLSVRSGSRASMPGMMDTVLNLGLNDEIINKSKENKRFLLDSYRRLIQMYADVVKSCEREEYEKTLENMKKEKDYKLDTEMTEEDLKNIVGKYKNVYKEQTGEDFPNDPKTQLINSVESVFKSWNNERAKYYRKMHNIPASWGTAVNIQEMVYGNISNNSGTGVAFTRDPSTGENKLYGEYLMNAQGEDVVAGIRTPNPISKLQEDMPEVYEEFLKNSKLLEKHYKDMQDMEFTIENGKLYMLQTRNGKRTSRAAIKIALDQLDEGLIDEKEAILRVDAESLDQLLHPNFVESDLKKAKKIAKGLAASPGAATGQIYFDSNTATKEKEKGKKVVLVRVETSPEDIQGMQDSVATLTVRGGMTSHAAVVARGMGKCCVVGCEDLEINFNQKTLKTKDGDVFNEGDFISVNGTTGNVYSGKIKTEDPKLDEDFKRFMSIADKYRRLKVRTNADNEHDAKVALSFGAEGIGLCRTEHMFFDKERILNVRKMIMADSDKKRQEALNKILPYQQSDFEKLFESMDGKSITIRYLDPPLHEFLPKENKDIKSLADEMKVSSKKLKDRLNELSEFNPMMGHRGCRLSITYPELAVMQTKALINAAINVYKKGIYVTPEIMIPLVSDVKEFKYLKNIVEETANEIFEKEAIFISYSIGTMIEVPRACILSDKIADEAEFFSFGTNDLTQMTYGFSRDDAAKFLKGYYKKEIFDFDPFVKLDREGVGQMIKIATKLGRRQNKQLKVGICGEHAGNPESIDICEEISLDYISCSPYRVPIARLAAAQAVLRKQGDVE